MQLSLLTTAGTERHLEGDSNDYEHDSDSNCGVRAGDRANDSNDQHKEAHQSDTGEVQRSSTDSTNDCRKLP
jgi:hypothetical protein